MEYTNDDLPPRKPLSDWETNATRAWLFGIVWAAFLCAANMLSDSFRPPWLQLSKPGSGIVWWGIGEFIFLSSGGAFMSIPYVIALGDWEKRKQDAPPCFAARSLVTAAVWFAVPAFLGGWHSRYGPEEWNGLNVRLILAVYVASLMGAWAVGRMLPRVQQNRVQAVYNNWEPFVWLTALLSLWVIVAFLFPVFGRA